MVIVLTRGLPASGKSTHAKAWVAADPKNRIRVNRDDIRAMQGITTGVGTHEQENLVTLIEEGVVREALKKGKHVVIDATHLRAAYVKKWAGFGEIQIRDFVVPVDELVRRDNTRAHQGERAVGERVIRDMAQRFHIKADGTLPPLPDLDGIGPTFDFKPYVKGPQLAYSFDIDGTLLQMEDRRGPYETDKYHLDTPDRNVVEMLWHLQDGVQKSREDVAFIALSGRNEDYRDVTLESLRGWSIYLDALYMRPSDRPNDNDALIKSDLVDQYYSGVYDVIMHFDDRNRVVDALRAKGVKVAQVQPGDF